MTADNKYEYVSEMIKFIDASPTCFHAVSNIEKMLTGFEKLDEKSLWNIEAGKSYYVIRKDSSIIAFRVPKNKYSSIRITSSHSDSPSFKIKPEAIMETEGHYLRVNTEKYGGMIISSFLDRPLSIAGRVVVKEGNGLKNKLFNIDRNLLMIPSVAIHMNREVNDGYKYNAQVDTIPLLGMMDSDGKGNKNYKDSLRKIIAESAGVAAQDIMGEDLFLYIREPGTVWGMNNEFVSSRALDDLQCAYGTTKGFVESLSEINEDSDNILSVCCIFDNEEVGSLTAQGADSTFLKDTLYRINEALTFDESTLLMAIANGYMVSADNAHAVHPNHPEYADPTNRPYLNEGIVIKYNASQKYTTDAESEAMFKMVCSEANVKTQTFTNRSNMAGGSTLGNISNRHISIRTVDIGLPQLSMHSAYETSGVMDLEYLIKAMKVFYLLPLQVV